MNQRTPYEGPERRQGFLSGDMFVPAKWVLAVIIAMFGLLGLVWAASGIWTERARDILDQKTAVVDVKRELTAKVETLKTDLTARLDRDDLDRNALRALLGETVNTLGQVQLQLRYLYHEIPPAGPPSGAKR